MDILDKLKLMLKWALPSDCETINEAADEIERLREALQEIIYYDVAWDSEKVGTIDGPCATLARSALQQKESE